MASFDEFTKSQFAKSISTEQVDDVFFLVSKQMAKISSVFQSFSSVKCFPIQTTISVNTSLLWNLLSLFHKLVEFCNTIKSAEVKRKKNFCFIYLHMFLFS